MDIFDSWLVSKYIANRGFHNEDIPENSLASFEAAIKRNYAISISLRRLADGTIVVFHDEKLGRMTGEDGYISQFTYDEIKPLKLNKTTERIPTLKETLDCINGRAPLLIEIRNMNKVGYEKQVMKILEGYTGEYAIQSFNPYCLEWFKQNAPHVKRGQMSSFFKHEDLGCINKIALTKMKFNKAISEPNFISYNADNIPNRFVNKFKDLPLIVWTIRSQEQYDKLKKNCDNIIFELFDPVI